MLDKNTITFVMLVGILIIGSLFIKENFVDASGSKVDASGTLVTLSLSDLFSLFSTTTGSSNSKPSTTSTSSLTYDTDEPTLDQQFLTTLTKEIKKDVRETVRSQLNEQTSAKARAEGEVLTDSCIDSVANQQGTDWMRYIPGKNPADYIRKDSIPCYS